MKEVELNGSPSTVKLAEANGSPVTVSDTLPSPRHAEGTEEVDGFDTLLLDAVGFGRWQLWCALLVTMVALILPVHLIGVALLSPPLPFRCFTHPEGYPQTMLPDSPRLDLENTTSNPHNTSWYNDVCLTPNNNNENTISTTNNNNDNTISTTTTNNDNTISTTNNNDNTISTTNNNHNNISTTTNNNDNTISTTNNNNDNTISITNNNNNHNLTEDSTPLPPGRYSTGLPSCPYIEYDTSVFTSSIVSQFHLVCERSHLQPYYQMVYNIGGILGSTAGGQIGDRYGRLMAVKVGSFLTLVAVAAMLLVPSYPMVLVARFVLGVSTIGSLIPAWNMVLESTPSKTRSLVGMLMGTPYSFFIIVFASVAYFVRDWLTLFFITASPVLALLPLCFLVDESPRWLLQQGRGKEVHKIMEKAVRQNNVKLSQPLSTIIDNILKSNGNKTKEEMQLTVSYKAQVQKAVHQALQYFKSPGMRVILFTTPFIWFFHSLLYLGVAINANNFTKTNQFLYVALTGVMDGGSILLITPLTGWLGRKVLVGGGLFLSGVLLLLDLPIPLDYYWLKWILVMTGFFLSAGSFQVNYIYAPELFPTEARTRGFAFLSMIGNVGFMCAPFITTLMAQYSWWAVGVMFGCSGIVASLLVPLLPETNQKPMPETLQEVDNRWRPGRRKEKEVVVGGIANMAYQQGEEAK